MSQEHLQRTPTSDGNKRRWTWAGWCKITDTSVSNNAIFGCWFGGSSRYTLFRFTNQKLQYFSGNFTTDGSSTTNQAWVDSDRVFRDLSGWCHIMVVFDSTITTNAYERLKIYVNGVYVEYTVTSNLLPALSAESFINSRNPQVVGSWAIEGQNGGQYYEGEMSDVFLVDGQALTPSVFGFYKNNDGYVSAGSTMSTDFRQGQWMPKSPSVIKNVINDSGGFGVNGYYMPMNDSSNPGADFHCSPNSIIKLKGEDLPQPRNGAPTTSDDFVSELRQEQGELGFDGAVKFLRTGGYLDLGTGHSELVPGTGDFTVECFLYANEFGNYPSIVDTRTSSSDTLGFFFGLNTSGQLYLYSHSAERNRVVIQKGQWYHVALVRESNVFKLYLDGRKVGIDYTQSQNYSRQIRYIGESSNTESQNWNMESFISNFRFTQAAVYTSNFTVPTEPLNSVTNTRLLCCQSSTSATATTVAPGSITASGGAFATRNELTGSTLLAVPGASLRNGSFITNGNFETGISGWSTGNSATATYLSTSGPAGNGCINVQSNSSSNGYVFRALSSNLTVGQRYTVSFSYQHVSGSAGYVNVGNSTGASELVYYVLGTTNKWVKANISFTAAVGATFVGFYSRASSGVVRFADIELSQENVPGDYSANISGNGSNKTLTPFNHAGIGYDLGGYYGSAITLEAANSGAFNYSVPNNDPLFLQRNFTVELWAKIGSGITDDRYFLTLLSGGSTNAQSSWYLRLNSSKYEGVYVNGGTQYITISGNDYVPDQWTHIVYEREDNTQRLYINGVCEALTSYTPLPNVNSGSLLYIGSSWNLNNPIEAEMQDIRIYDGIAKYKGGFDVPKPYTPFNFENDDWRTHGDIVKNNYSTLNPLLGVGRQDQMTYSKGNLRVVSGATSGTDTSAVSNMAIKGKMYCEFALTTSGIGAYVGIMKYNTNLTNSGTDTTASTDIWIVRGDNGNKANGEGGSGVSYGSAFATGDVIMLAVDIDNTSIWIGKNGTWFNSGDPAAGTNAAYTNLPSTEDLLVICGDNYSSETPTIELNFGQNPSFNGKFTPGTNADNTGKGLFRYAPPSGFLAMCEDNLPAPAIADPGDHFKTVLYTGSGAAGLNVEKVGFQPDLVWIKNRCSSRSHNVYDSVRGPGKRLQPDLTNIESDVLGVSAFNNDGFTLGAGTDDTNFNLGEYYVAWCWKAGGASVPNDDGSITTQVSANTTAGFSIVSGTPTNGATAGHGLGKTPDFIIYKARNASQYWRTFHKDLLSTDSLYLSETNASTADSDRVTAVTSTTFTYGAIVGSTPYIAYCWTEIDGYSKFGSYEGNNSADGPFIYCGFKPAWIMFKNIDAVTNWVMVDSSRDPTNSSYNDILFPDGNFPANTGANKYLDFCSNGFKLRGTSNAVNAAASYVFMAFAESPFQTANAK